MAARPTLPYFAPEDLLPAPLPSVEEILASTTFLVRYGEALVVRVGDHFVVKYGKKETDQNFIVQEHVAGQSLDSVWSTLSRCEKMGITWQLRRSMDELRSIPSPGYYGGVWGQPVLDRSFRHLDPWHRWPKVTADEWCMDMWHCLDKKLEGEDRNILPVLRFVYLDALGNHPPVFTHGDLYPGNIILREDNTPVIMNWESAGWYPAFWEYCCAMLLLQYRYDWAMLVPAFLDTYVAELGWVQGFRELMLRE